MISIKETIVVEGRYDKNHLKQFLDAHIVETTGFRVFSDKEKLALLRALADKNGLIVLVDSDGAGFVIRNFLKGALPPEKVKHAYIPQLAGKERRKSSPSAEGLLGVEGVSREIVEKALENAGATICGGEEKRQNGGITKARLYMDGLSGREGSADLRVRLLSELKLPSYMSVNALLEALNILISEDEYKKLVEKIKK